ncbi:MAG: transcription-repair coupling factor [Clostridia bacterium]|nr:transcription-repair coupling factor [Clostridia bacterium]
MKFLDGVLRGVEEYRELSRSIELGRFPAMATGLSGIHKAHLIHSLCTEKNCGALVIASDEAEAQKLCSDLATMGTDTVFYPSRDYTFRDVEGVSREFEHQRITALYALQSGKSKVIVACVDAVMQYTIPPQKLKDTTVEIKEGTEVSLEKIIAALTADGYVRVEQVEGTGQFAVRGGILDFFMPSSSQPCRVEFWGDEIDTVSAFDIDTQRRTEKLDGFVITPSCEILVDDIDGLVQKINKKASSLRGKTAAQAREIMYRETELLKNTGRLTSIDKYYSLIYETPANLFSYIPQNFLVFVSEQSKLKERMRATIWQWGEDIKDYLSEGILCKGMDCYTGDWTDELTELSNRNTIFIDNFARGSSEVPLRELVNFNFRHLSAWSGSVNVLCEDLQTLRDSDKVCVILAGTQKSAENLFKEMCDRGYSAKFLKNDDELSGEGIYICSGSLSAGFEYPSAAFCLITHSQVAVNLRKKKRSQPKSKAVFSLAELSVGDYVVHTAHGIGQFDGIHKIDMHGIVKDYIKIKYAKGDILYVPVTQLDLVSKYIGPREEATVKLNKIGGLEWQRAKNRVRTAVKDIADELIKLYSERMKAKGHAFPPDTDWQADFEQKFEYEETADQKRCIAEIKSDMEKPSPMDRLLCGDVGFGKTEVALRAAFKCVADSKQCAILVPTTILAWQHYQTALRRFEGFPINIELLSRFRTPSQQDSIINKLKHGDVDIVIGTHRLVSNDVKFRDLGLVIIDEEQRFGVAQKEKLKEMCKNVDVLTLSATPIPRTLNMAMSGIRDMSTLEEAPQDRHPIQTYVLEYDDAVINEAIRRELRRGGQVFYLFNSVEGIENKAQEIRDRVPEAKVGVGHGKMTESQLSEVWRQMLEQEINVLVSTTIIETGVDIPNANTLVIENADKMGLSQLHQIRGRVGRSSRRAYAYLTFQRDKVLTEISQKRLDAIKEFTEFGSGFKIAMRDLELRGAGNILGAKQHGHMADVGYDMYMKLLNEAVSAAKGEAPADTDLDCLVDVQIEAHIPESYISNLNRRLEIYRRIADIRTEDDASDVIDELIDRFGDMPESVQGLIDIALIRSKAEKIGIYEIKQQPDYVLFYVKQINTEPVAEIIGRMKGRAMLSAGSKPYIAVRIRSNDTVMGIMNEVMMKNSKKSGIN